VSDTAEYGDYVAGPRIVDERTRGVMRELLSEIRDGSFAREWIAENDAGLPRFKRTRAAETSQQIEDVGRSLRRMMPFVNAREVVPGAASA
jgi:ketol-acid reductoisomerase